MNERQIGGSHFGYSSIHDRFSPALGVHSFFQHKLPMRIALVFGVLLLAGLAVAIVNAGQCNGGNTGSGSDHGGTPHRHLASWTVRASNCTLSISTGSNVTVTSKNPSCVPYHDCYNTITGRRVCFTAYRASLSFSVRIMDYEQAWHGGWESWFYSKSYSSGTCDSRGILPPIPNSGQN